AILLDRDNEEKQLLVLKEHLSSEIREGDIIQLSYHEKTDEIDNIEILKVDTQSVKQKAEQLL
uniref:hypothetical protein n=1 Tax=Sporosarcina sp. ZBG7A TaxID=1582223 RepID=UPI00057AF26F